MLFIFTILTHAHASGKTTWFQTDFIWSQCPNVGNVHPADVETCKAICLNTEGCTAINFSSVFSDCVLRACELPVPEPKTDNQSYKGYYMGEAPSYECPTGFTEPGLVRYTEYWWLGDICRSPEYNGIVGWACPDGCSKKNDQPWCHKKGSPTEPCRVPAPSYKCPTGFTEPGLERHTEEWWHGDVCRNAGFHGMNVGWACPEGCTAKNGGPWCLQQGSSTVPCRVPGARRRLPEVPSLSALPSSSMPAPARCSLTGGETVQHGWSGKDTGANSCNSCSCSDGTLTCTETHCGSLPATCTLTGGETVQHGWSGKDTGTNSCNTCHCEGGALGCTRMMCPQPKWIDLWWTCDDGLWVLNEYKCDGYLDCLDGSDEKGCPPPKHSHRRAEDTTSGAQRVPPQLTPQSRLDYYDGPLYASLEEPDRRRWRGCDDPRACGRKTCPFGRDDLCLPEVCDIIDDEQQPCFAECGCEEILQWIESEFRRLSIETAVDVKEDTTASHEASSSSVKKDESVQNAD